MFYFLLIIFGITGGLLGGMGMGGGTLLIPMLTLFLSIPQKQAQAINLIGFLPMAVVAIILHIKNKLINVKVALYLIIPAILFSLLGSFLLTFIKGNILSKLFGGFLIILSIIQFALNIKANNKNPAGSKDQF